MSRVDVILVGGGSGGHITPLISIAESIKSSKKELKIAHIGKKYDKLNAMTHESPYIDSYYEIFAGKYRRYNGEKWYIKIFDLKTLFFNVRDLFLVITGIFQSWILLNKLRPKVIFIKGGFVSVPVGLVAGWKGIPYITHDSDAMISLANRLISKNAKLHLTAMPTQYYELYDKNKTIQVGIPVRSEFNKVTEKEKAQLKVQLGYKSSDKVLLIVGGGLGARRINEAIINSVNVLFKEIKGLKILLITGHKLYEESVKSLSKAVEEKYKKSINILPLSHELHNLSGAADLIVTRAGATSIAEFAMQAKACIIVPNPLLTGGHQLKNADVYEKNNVAKIVNEDSLNKELIPAISNLMNNLQQLKKYELNLYKLSTPETAKEISKKLLDYV